jgi:hypothetical protein
LDQARCTTFRDHLGEANINSTFAASLRTSCPAAQSTSTDNNLAPLDVTTPNTFDNAYYSNLLSQRGLLHSDQELFNNGSTDSIVRNFASNAAAFTSAFATAMVTMGNLQPLTGTQGQIRRNCWRVNSNKPNFGGTKRIHMPIRCYEHIPAYANKVVRAPPPCSMKCMEWRQPCISTYVTISHAKALRD